MCSRSANVASAWISLASIAMARAIRAMPGLAGAAKSSATPASPATFLARAAADDEDLHDARNFYFVRRLRGGRAELTAAELSA
jgi:hypothetical protein